MWTVKLDVPFPPAIKQKVCKRGSIHASTIVSISNGEEDEREILKNWFQQALADTKHFFLLKPDHDARQATASRNFWDYKDHIEALGLKVWDIQNTTGDTAHIILEDSNGSQEKLSGRADFIISSTHAKCHAAAMHNAVCVVEKQSKPNQEDCEYQMVTYLVIMMNRYGFKFLTGILLYTDGSCRAYRASRDTKGNNIFEENDTFGLYQIADVLPTLLTKPQ